MFAAALLRLLLLPPPPPLRLSIVHDIDLVLSLSCLHSITALKPEQQRVLFAWWLYYLTGFLWSDKVHFDCIGKQLLKSIVMWTVSPRCDFTPVLSSSTARHLAQIQWISHTACVYMADENTAEYVWQQTSERVSALHWLKEVGHTKNIARMALPTCIPSPQGRNPKYKPIPNQLYELAENNSWKEDDCAVHVPRRDPTRLEKYSNIHLYQSCRFKLFAWKQPKIRKLQ